LEQENSYDDTRQSSSRTISRSVECRGGTEVCRAVTSGLTSRVEVTHFFDVLDSARSGLQLRSSVMETTGNSRAMMHSNASPLVRWGCSVADDGARAL